MEEHCFGFIGYNLDEEWSGFSDVAYDILNASVGSTELLVASGIGVFLET